MEIRSWSYDAFPAYAEPTEGAVWMDTTGDEVGVLYTQQQIVYMTAEGTPLHMDVLTPFTRNRPDAVYPCIAFVPGSAWMQQNIALVLPLLAQLARRGFIVAAVEYRHSGLAHYPAQIVDARNAVRYLRLHAQELHIDPARMLLAGDSSGGHTAVFGALRHNDDTPENAFPGVSAEVCGVVDYYGSVSVLTEDANPSTPNHKLPDSPEGRVMGGVNLRERPDLCRELSAQCHITKDTALAPMLILHGTKDRIVNAEQSVALYRCLRAAGKDAALYLLRGADHGGAEFWTPQVLDVVEAFARRCMR
ncbi:MAG: alpha/beta hydrolase [Oscillospiraceae bacterium]|nr:alpha/beta hydrolase [Oscillospiraceae bacterium]